jgi:lipoprotein NlpI
VHNVLGELLLRQGKNSEALAEFDRSIALDPSFEQAKKNREQALDAARATLPSIQ